MVDTLRKVVIADSQYLVVESLKALLTGEGRFIVSSVVNTKSDTIRSLEAEKCELLITDINLIDYDGIPDLQQLKLKYPNLGILVLTNSVSKAEFTELSKSGIKNILYKTADRDDILSAIESTLKGKKYYSEEILDLMLDTNENKQAPEEPAALTSSEIEIVRLIAEGMTTKEIANYKHISFHTVNTHRKNIFRKIGVSSASELIMYAIKAGWIDNIEYFI